MRITKQAKRRSLAKLQHLHGDKLVVKIDKIFGDKLNAEMKKHGVSQPALAKRLGKSNTAAWALVHGRTDPTRSIRSGLRQVRAIAEAVGCDVDDLLT